MHRGDRIEPMLCCVTTRESKRNKRADRSSGRASIEDSFWWSFARFHVILRAFYSLVQTYHAHPFPSTVSNNTKINFWDDILGILKTRCVGRRGGKGWGSRDMWNTAKQMLVSMILLPFVSKRTLLASSLWARMTSTGKQLTK